MLSIPANVRVYLCTTPTDMRKSFDGLHTLVRQVFEIDAMHLAMLLSGVDVESAKRRKRYSRVA